MLLKYKNKCKWAFTMLWRWSLSCWASCDIRWANWLRSSLFLQTSLFCISARTYSTTVSHWHSSFSLCRWWM